jgi:two-component system, chemotaxis family, chemotaxis protein CheY
MFDQKIPILIVDDMASTRTFVRKALAELGYQNIEEAADGVEGYRLATEARAPIGLIISDWNMPNMNGLDLLKKVRADERLKKVPFIMLTTEAEQGSMIEAVKAGASNYILKPVNAETLLKKLESIYKKLGAG